MTSDKSLQEIWAQVPPDYYQRGVAGNLPQRVWHGHKLRTLARILPRRLFSRVADVGCAGGYMAAQIARLLPGASVVGIDVYTEALVYGRHTYPDLQFVAADGHALPFRDEALDLVLCYETIEHVTDPGGLLSELRRVVCRDGTVVVAMDSGSRLFRLVSYVWERTRGWSRRPHTCTPSPTRSWRSGSRRQCSGCRGSGSPTWGWISRLCWRQGPCPSL